jgi:ABC-type glycerol-3-phosphate transport system substrate-binding protein
VPDLIALPHNLLESAALRGMVYPHPDLKPLIQDKQWFDYAQQLAQVQGSIYGLPFAGDALTLVYRPSVIPEPPQNWSETLAAQHPLIFPAADPNALFTLTLYQAEGGIVQDEQSRPVINAITLTEVLTYYMQAEKAGIMPSLLTQYQSDDQVWEAYQKGQAQMVITWLSRYLDGTSEDQAAALIPTSDGQPFTLAAGWVWAIAARDPQRQSAALELAEFLTDSAFLAQWTEAAGYLPPRPDVLMRWSNPATQGVARQTAQSASLFPANDILGSLGPDLWQATIDVLKAQEDPASAARTAASSSNVP